MLLRPIGQQVFAKAVAEVTARALMTWDEVGARLGGLDANGKFRLASESNLWYGILYNPSKRSVHR